MKALCKYMCFTYLKYYVGSLFALGAAAALLNLLFPAGFFQSYFEGFSIYSLVMALITTTLLTGSWFNVALSMGARRRDYFIAMQLSIIVGVAASMVLIYAMQFISEHAFSKYGYDFMFNPGMAPHTVIAVFAAQLVGCLCTVAGMWKKWLSVAVCVVYMMLAVTVLLVQMTALEGIFWFSLPWILSGVELLFAAGAEFIVLRYMNRAVVR